MKQIIFIILFLLIQSNGFSQTKGEFSNGLAWIKKGGKYGFVNKQGKIVIRIKYDSVFTFREGVTPVKQKKAWYYIDRKGQRIHKADAITENFTYEFARPYYNGLAVVMNRYEGDSTYRYYPIGKSGYCDWTDFTADSLGDFDKGYAIIKRWNHYGILSACNDYLVPVEYDKIDSFSNGYAKVLFNNQLLILSPYGKCISNCEGFVSTEQEDEKDIFTLSFPNTGNWLNEITMYKLDSLSKIILNDSNKKYVISGNGDFSYTGQLVGWKNANRVLNYLTVNKKINQNRFIFQYGQNGKYRTVNIRPANIDEDGPSITPPPFSCFMMDN